MLASNPGWLAPLHAAFARWGRQGRRGAGTETHPLHLRGLGCGAPGMRGQRVCWFHVCKALCDRHISNRGKPAYNAVGAPLWGVCGVFRASRSWRFYISCTCACFGCLSPFRLLLCFSISYPLCFFRSPCCIHTLFSLTVLVFHLIDLAPRHVPPDKAHEAGMCHRLTNCSPLSPWRWGWIQGWCKRSRTQLLCLIAFCCLCFPPLLRDWLCRRLTHGNGLGARSNRHWISGNRASLPLLPCAELAIKSIRAMAGGSSSKSWN